MTTVIAAFVILTVGLVTVCLITQGLAAAQPGDQGLAHFAALTRALMIFTLCCEAVLFMTGLAYWVTIARSTRPPDRKQQAAEFEAQMRHQAVAKAAERDRRGF